MDYIQKKNIDGNNQYGSRNSTKENHNQSMYIDYYQSYLAMIHNSIGSNTWKNLFVHKENNQTIDILQDGNISCAFFVSSILKQFGYCGATFANVLSLEKHLLAYGREEHNNFNEDNIIVGSVIIRDEKNGSEKLDVYGNIIKGHYHVGFYIGEGRAISNMSDGFAIDDMSARTPQEHHFTYHGNRPIYRVLKWNFTKTLEQHILKTRMTSHINIQLEIPFIGQTESHLEQYGFCGDELDRALGSKEGLELGRMCGGACIVMAYQYLTGKKDKTLLDIVSYKDISHKKGGYRNKEYGWYHDGLIAIATDRGLSGKRGSIDVTDVNNLKEHIADCIDKKKVLLLSISVGYDKSKQGGHLVVIRGYNRNGYEEELIINDPLDPKAVDGFSGSPISKKLSDILDCWSGKYIIISK